MNYTVSCLILGIIMAVAGGSCDYFKISGGMSFMVGVAWATILSIVYEFIKD